MKSPRTIHISIITIALLQNFTSNGIDTPALSTDQNI